MPRRFLSSPRNSFKRKTKNSLSFSLEASLVPQMEWGPMLSSMVTISFDGVSALVAETGNPRIRNMIITTASVTTLAGTTTGSFYKWNWNQLQI
jgi:hypothetical protein